MQKIEIGAFKEYDASTRLAASNIGRSALGFRRFLSSERQRGLERNLVLVRFGRRSFWRRRRPARARTAFFVSPAAAAAAATGPAAKKLQTFSDNFQLAPFLPGLLVVPGVELQAALDENGPPFL